jgi:hypothetical protein
MPRGGGLKMPRPKLDCSSIEEDEKEEEEEEEGEEDEEDET